MKTITHILFCLILTTVAVRAEDFHMVQAPIQDELATNNAFPIPSVYVLVLSNDAVVFKTFDSREMELTIARLVESGSIPPGSVLHVDGPGYLNGPSYEQSLAFRDFCIRIGIKLGVTARL